MDEFEFRGDEAFRKWLFTQASRKLVDKHRYYTREKRDAAREVAVSPPGDKDDSTMVACYATFCTPSRAPTARA